MVVVFQQAPKLSLRKVGLNNNQPAPPPTVPQKQDPVSLLVDCAVESFIEALMTLIWGKVIFSLVGGIIGDMIPSLPPGMAGTPSPQHPNTDFGGSWFSSDSHQLGLVFAVFFLLNLRVRVAGPLLGDAGRQTRLHRIAGRLREDGLSLLFVNAITALIAAWLASLAINFSWAQLLLHWLFDAITPTLNYLANRIFGPAGVGAAQGWWNWWGDNQLKFNFWLFYIAAICDDLGIPNLKTLARFFWRRLRPGNPAPLPASGQPPGAA
jgi:hypothetical protein